MSKNILLSGALGARVDRACDDACHGAGQAQGDGRRASSDRLRRSIIGNSFFYYNNSLHNHVTRLIRAADPSYRFRTTSVTISGLGLGLARRRLLFPAQCDRALFVRRREQHRVQQDRSAVRSCNHDGLQPVPGASAAASRYSSSR